MKTMAMRLMLAMGLLTLPALGTGCDGEPEGSCVTTESGSYSGYDPSSYETHQICQQNVSASACAQARGTFQEGGDCAVFDFFQAISAN